MNLKNFREAANEKTRDVRMTPELSRRIQSALAAEKQPQARRRSWLAVAACLAVMVLSASVLALGSTLHRGSTPGTAGHYAITVLGSEGAEMVAAQDTGTALPIATDAMLDAQRYVPKQDDITGLWGYYDTEAGDWFHSPAYSECLPLKNMTGVATTPEGETVWIIFP